ncbi:putative DNA-binding protein with PD1-like motif [Chryseobacterium sp. H1D6B]|uniref:PPC domain-containing DNA-binding protein n=1 Tax=Chryseobacterium sp. H1D6B TaxID=2940588 RepID=UPI0015CAC97A|nr:PPC domain-containing DNA-binding protein [Chryseobacterium sp. H1D6B]MDH6253788.1 putative DNA-binding protein with PD1-like motif [Chryseobacterium sp. H1D6B]
MDSQNYKGSNWTAKKVDSTYIVSVKDRSSIVETLTDFVTAQNIKAGQITGIGAVSEATLRFFQPSSKQYVDKKFSEQMEISNISGNVSELEGKPLLHLHITLGRQDYTALAGHLLDAEIRGAGEFFFYPLNTAVIKTKNEEAGINFYDLEK